jgi:hypothetical protein
MSGKDNRNSGKAKRMSDRFNHISGKGTLIINHLSLTTSFLHS